MMKRFITPMMALCVLMSLIGLVYAAGDENVTLTGHLVDKACSARVAKNANPQEAAAGHTKGCALMEGCQKSGFGVFSDGKFHEFDEASVAKAVAALEKSSKSKGAVFKVMGKMKDGKVAVDSISEME